MGRVLHFEFMAEDPEQLVRFYSTVFGWEITKWDGPQDYWLIGTGSGPGIDGGIARLSQQGTPGYTNVVVDVDDLDASIEKALANGGEIVMPRMEVPGIGYLAYVKDPTGNDFGMMERLKR